MAAKKQNSDVEKIEPGMVVEIPIREKLHPLHQLERSRWHLKNKIVCLIRWSKKYRLRIVMFAAAILLFYGLATGQGG